MPRPDPLSRFNPNNKSKLYPALNSLEYEMEELRAKARQAERLAEIAIRERDELRRELRRYGIDRKKRRRKPPEAGIAVPAVPPKGPLPRQGGAEAPLEFD